MFEKLMKAKQKIKITNIFQNMNFRNANSNWNKYSKESI